MVVILSHGLVFPDIEPPTIIILHWRSGICCQYGSCSCLFSFVILSKLIIIFNFSFLGILTILLFTLLKHMFHIILYHSIKCLQSLVIFCTQCNLVNFCGEYTAYFTFIFYCEFTIVSLFSWQVLQFLSLILRFFAPFFMPFVFLST